MRARAASRAGLVAGGGEIWLGTQGPGGHGGGHAEDVRQFLLISSTFTLPPTRGRRGFGTPARSKHVEALRGQVSNARDERVAEDRAGGEDMVGEAARVGVLFADAPPGLIHQEPVEDVGRFVDGGRDGLGGERGEPAGDARVRLDARGSSLYRALTRLRASPRPADGKNLPSLGGGPPGAPEDGHRQRGLGLDDDGQRSVERVAFHVPAGDAHQLPEPVRGRGLGHLAQAEVDALGEQHVEQTDAVAAG